MPDFGDELGSGMEQTLKRTAEMIVFSAIQRFLHDMRSQNYKTYPGNVYNNYPKEKSEYLINSIDEKDFEIFFENADDYERAEKAFEKFDTVNSPDFNSITATKPFMGEMTKILDDKGFHEVGRLERLKNSTKELVCIQSCNTIEGRNAILEMLKKNGIAAEPVNSNPPSVKYYKNDIPKIEIIVEEYIKSHDGMDLDSRTAVNEIDTPAERKDMEKTVAMNDIAKGTSWKADITEKVYEARLSATTEQEFIKGCEERGIKVTHAKDGELMYIHPSGDHLKIRGDTLGKDYTHASFKNKPLNLADEAMDMRTAAKALSAFEHSIGKDRNAPNIASRTK